MTSSEATPAARIRELLASVVEYGMRPDVIEGASDSAIRRMVEDQGVTRMPAAAYEVFSLLGSNKGPWWIGSIFGVDQLDRETKDLALEYLGYSEGDLVDPTGMLVLLNHAGGEFHVVDGVDVGLDDPPVWRIYEGEPLVRQWDSVTAWFTSATASVRYFCDEVARARVEGGLGLRYERYFR